MATGLLSFLIGVAFISLSGVMMPGPVFAVTLAKGQKHPAAGAFIGLGHGIVELPLVLLIWFGFARFFTSAAWKSGVGLLGGFVLVLIGLDMIRKRNDLADRSAELPYGSTAAGLLTSLANPYFYIWWATIGAALVVKAAAWGILGLGLFYLVHWLCDFGWSLLVSAASHRAGGIWSEKVHRVVFALCGLLLVGFGAWFIRAALTPQA